MGNYYGGQYLETRLGEVKKAQRTTLYAEAHQQGYHVRMVVLAYEWAVNGSYRSEGLVEMRLHGSVTHDGLAPVTVSPEGTLDHLSPTQLVELKAVLATPGDFALTWLLQDHTVALGDNMLRRVMGISGTIFDLVDTAVARFMHEHPDWEPPERDYRWEN